MTLFYKYYNRTLLFAADVLAALHGANGNAMSRSGLEQLSRRYGISPHLCAKVLALLKKLKLITWQQSDPTIRLATDWTDTVPKLPTSAIEEDYLQWILQLPQAELFLPKELREKLSDPGKNWNEAAFIQEVTPFGEQTQPKLSQPEFRSILEAISRGCAISYRFKTRLTNETTKTTAVPWRIEYSAYDNRWWIILCVLGEERRCVKAWLDNLSGIRLEPHIHVEESEILSARNSMLMPEPIILHIHDARNALERCFLLMERQQLTESVLNDDGSATLCFRYYRFEENDILRQLLFLGSCVELISPQYMRKALLDRVEQALCNFDA